VHKWTMTFFCPPRGFFPAAPRRAGGKALRDRGLTP
jgi:hypothetical protein